MGGEGVWALLWLIAAPFGLFVGAASRQALSQRIGDRAVLILVLGSLLLGLALAVTVTWLALQNPGEWKARVGQSVALLVFLLCFAAASATRSRVLLVLSVFTALFVGVVVFQGWQYVATRA